MLKREGFSGVLALTLPEALWLVGTDVTDDVLVGYPTADRGALFRLVQDEQLAATVTIMVPSGAPATYRIRFNPGAIDVTINPASAAPSCTPGVP
mgnify:CR=1 FL=1